MHDFLKLFPDSIILFQHDVEAYVASDYMAAFLFTEELGKAKQAEGFAPMYTINAFYTSPERLEISKTQYRLNRGETAKMPSSVRFKENLQKVQACFLDLDLRKEGQVVDIDKLKQEVVKKLEACPVPPTCYVITKNGLQVLWSVYDYKEEVRDEYLKQYKEVEMGIIEWSKSLGGYGDQVKDVARIFRLPGFNHLKNPKEPFRIEWWPLSMQEYTLDELYDFFAPYIPVKQEVKNELPSTVTLKFDAKPSFNLHDAINQYVDIKEAVPAAFRAVGALFAVDRDGSRWWINERLSGNFYSKESKNIACSTSGVEPFAGPPFAVIINIFKHYGRTAKDAMVFMNQTWGSRLQSYVGEQEVATQVDSIQVSPTHFITDKDKFTHELFARRYGDYYSWGMPEVDKRGGLLTFGRMAIMGGQHSAGKSTFITEVAKINSLKKKTMLIPLEMGPDFTLMMLAVNLYNEDREGDMNYLSYGDVEEGYLYERPESEKSFFRKCIENVYDRYGNLYINNPPTYKLTDLLAFIEKYHKEENIRFFIIDHLHQLDTSEVPENGETQFFSAVAKGLNALAQRLNIALLCVVQLTKAANIKNADIDLSSFKGTSEFTSNAHRVVVIKKPFSEEPSTMEIKNTLKREGNMNPTENDIALRQAIETENRQFNTRNIRELLFLKTRGRDGGTMTVEFEAGIFNFKHYGKYR